MLIRLFICLPFLLWQFNCSANNLSWYANADVNLEIEKAVSEGNYSLFAYARRVVVVPGIRSFSAKELENSCGLKIVKTMGDNIHLEDNRELIRKASLFIRSYNKKMVIRCKTAQDAF